MFSQTLANLDTRCEFETLENELRTYVYVTNFAPLSRCGGHVSDVELIEIKKISVTDVELIVGFRIEITDGAALDCSGQCGGEVTRRTEVLKLKISRITERAVWETLDGVISGS